MKIRKEPKRIAASALRLNKLLRANGINPDVWLAQDGSSTWVHDDEGRSLVSIRRNIGHAGTGSYIINFYVRLDSYSQQSFVELFKKFLNGEGIQ